MRIEINPEHPEPRKIARAVYQMLKRKEAFDAVKFFSS